MPKVKNAYDEALVNQLVAQLQPVAALFQTEYCCWVHGDDEGIDYCRSCAEKQVAKLLQENPESEVCVDGGWGSEEAETCLTCHECGQPLEYSLLKYGVLYEYDHFKHKRKFDFSQPYLAYEIAALLDGLPNVESDEMPSGMNAFIARITKSVNQQFGCNLHARH